MGMEWRYAAMAANERKNSTWWNWCGFMAIFMPPTDSKQLFVFTAIDRARGRERERKRERSRVASFCVRNWLMFSNIAGGDLVVASSRTFYHRPHRGCPFQVFFWNFIFYTACEKGTQGLKGRGDQRVFLYQFAVCDGVSGDTKEHQPSRTNVLSLVVAVPKICSVVPIRERGER